VDFSKIVGNTSSPRKKVGTRRQTPASPQTTPLNVSYQRQGQLLKPLYIGLGLVGHWFFWTYVTPVQKKNHRWNKDLQIFS